MAEGRATKNCTKEKTCIVVYNMKFETGLRGTSLHACGAMEQFSFVCAQSKNAHTQTVHLELLGWIFPKKNSELKKLGQVGKIASSRAPALSAARCCSVSRACACAMVCGFQEKKAKPHPAYHTSGTGKRKKGNLSPEKVCE